MPSGPGVTRFVKMVLPTSTGPGRISGEFNEVRLLEIVDKAQEVVIYSSGERRDAASASAQAVTWGFQKVYYFHNGFQRWKAAGHLIEKGG